MCYVKPLSWFVDKTDRTGTVELKSRAVVRLSMRFDLYCLRMKEDIIFTMVAHNLQRSTSNLKKSIYYLFITFCISFLREIPNWSKLTTSRR